MKHYIKNILLQTILRENKNKAREVPSGYVFAKAYRIFLILLRRYSKDTLLIITGIGCAGFGFKGFLVTNQFIDGGATGISLLLSALTYLPLWLLIIMVNAPFVYLGYRIMGKTFAIKTAMAMMGLALCLAVVPYPEVTHDKLLVAVFGGFFLGAGIGFAIRGGCVIDGTEILAIYLSRKVGVTIGDVVMAINVFIFSAAAYFLGIEIALYSMITYLAASKTLDFLVEGIDEYIGVTIIASHHDEMRHMITHKLGRGVTVYSGKSGHGKRGETHDVDIIFTVITRLEVNKLTTEIEKSEPNACVVMHRIKDTKGGMIKKRPLK